MGRVVGSFRLSRTAWTLGRISISQHTKMRIGWLLWNFIWRLTLYHTIPWWWKPWINPFKYSYCNLHSHLSNVRSLLVSTCKIRQSPRSNMVLDLFRLVLLTGKGPWIIRQAQNRNMQDDFSKSPCETPQMPQIPQMPQTSCMRKIAEYILIALLLWLCIL